MGIVKETLHNVMVKVPHIPLGVVEYKVVPLNPNSRQGESSMTQPYSSLSLKGRAKERTPQPPDHGNHMYKCTLSLFKSFDRVASVKFNQYPLSLKKMALNYESTKSLSKLSSKLGKFFSRLVQHILFSAQD